MIIVTVARRPLSESTVASNVLAHGTGALNIDACRIGSGSGGEPPTYVPNLKNAVFGAGMGGGDWNSTKGRWPANLILGHLEGCRRAGTREVAGDGHWPASRSQGSEVCGPSGHKGQEGLMERDATRETVDVWECVGGCPVAELDEQSGSSKSSGFGGRTIVKRATGSERNGNMGAAYGEESRPEGSVMTSYDDAGGASRFFKQVQK